MAENSEEKKSKPAEETAENNTVKAPEGGQADQDPVLANQGESSGSRGRTKGRGARTVSAGIAHIKSTFNNTMVAITDTQGGVVAWSSAGKTGFKGSKKSTSFAATLAGQDAARQATGKGMREVEVRVQGAGSGRESAIRALQSSGLNITVIKDITPMPHNGCRPRKRRRV